MAANAHLAPCTYDCVGIRSSDPALSSVGTSAVAVLSCVGMSAIVAPPGSGGLEPDGGTLEGLQAASKPERVPLVLLGSWDATAIPLTSMKEEKEPCCRSPCNLRPLVPLVRSTGNTLGQDQVWGRQVVGIPSAAFAYGTGTSSRQRAYGGSSFSDPAGSTS
ncbi:hypothetical protein NDU88_005013 [Pleurodeles waltl]|uniref:Uncharacterized protein n=1 Tax=Pleurodeles waltl TaxID=8319 RepID=A0AAV7T9K5_PLEWA|nr:hypothetical protein NDU88_005013 [Pleurodeles waltl]